MPIQQGHAKDASPCGKRNCAFHCGFIWALTLQGPLVFHAEAVEGRIMKELVPSHTLFV